MDLGAAQSDEPAVSSVAEPPAWLGVGNLDRLLAALQREDFVIHPATRMRLDRLLLRLAEREPLPADPRALRHQLGSILVTNREEQITFGRIFAKWAEPFHDAVLPEPPILPDRPFLPRTTPGSRIRWGWCVGAAVALFVTGEALFLTSTTVSTWIDEAKKAALKLPGQLPNGSSAKKTWVLVTVALPCALFFGWAYLSITRRLEIFSRRVLGRWSDTSVPVAANDARRARTTALSTQMRIFGRRRVRPGSDLDVAASIRDTVRSGLPALRHGVRRVLPEYLVLIERRAEGDHLHRLGLELVEAMRRESVFVAAYTYHDVPHFRAIAGEHALTNRVLTLGEIAERHAEHTVIIVSDGLRMIAPFTRQVFEWVIGFNAWTEKFLFTPVPPDRWQEAEASLTAVGIVAVYFCEQGLAQMSEVLKREGSLATADFVWQDLTLEPAIPRALIVDERRWLENVEPPPAAVDALLGDLYQYLDAFGFRWLCACAAFPRLLPVLTNSLGQLLKDRDGAPIANEDRLLKLVRLPWFRAGRMPDWLRLRFLKELDADAVEQVKGEVLRLLGNVDASVAHDILPIANRPVTTPERSSLQPDRIFVDFVSTRASEVLSMPAPENFRRYASRLAGSRTVVVSFLSAAIALTLAVWWLSSDLSPFLKLLGQRLGHAGVLPMALIAMVTAQAGMIDWMVRAVRRDPQRGLFNRRLKIGQWHPLWLHVITLAVLFGCGVVTGVLGFMEPIDVSQKGLALPAPALSDADLLNLISVATVALASALAFQLIERPVFSARLPLPPKSRPPLLQALIAHPRPRTFLLKLFVGLAAINLFTPLAQIVGINNAPLESVFPLLFWPALGFFVLYGLREGLGIPRRAMTGIIVLPLWMLFSVCLAPDLLTQLPMDDIWGQIFTGPNAFWYYASLAVVADRLRVIHLADGLFVARASAIGGILFVISKATFGDANEMFYDVCEGAALLWLLRRYLSLSASRIAALALVIVLASALFDIGGARSLVNTLNAQPGASAASAFFGIPWYPAFLCTCGAALYRIAFRPERSRRFRRDKPAHTPPSESPSPVPKPAAPEAKRAQLPTKAAEPPNTMEKVGDGKTKSTSSSTSSSRFFDIKGNVVLQHAGAVGAARYELREPIRFRSDIAGGVIVVPAGYTSDLTSIPQFAWSIFMAPNDPRLALASWVHDLLYSAHGRVTLEDGRPIALTRQQCDRILVVEAMPELLATSFQRFAIYLAVRLSGRAWSGDSFFERMS